MADFNDNHKEEMSNNYFDQGVHKVSIGLIQFDKTDDGKEFVEFTLLGDEEQEGTARLWFTTDAAIKYSFNTIRSIFVHNAPKSKKDSIRKQIDSLKNTKELEDACSILVGKECWYSVYENKDRKFIGNDGKERYSYDRNVYGYEPKPKEVSSDDSEPEIQDGDITDDGKVVAF